MKKQLGKIWEVTEAIGWALTNVPQAEKEHARSKRTCPSCGYIRERPEGIGFL